MILLILQSVEFLVVTTGRYMLCLCYKTLFCKYKEIFAENNTVPVDLLQYTPGAAQAQTLFSGSRKHH